METLHSILAFATGLVVRLALVLLFLAVVAAAAGLALVAVRLLQRAGLAVAGLDRVGGLLVKRDRFYAPGHTWLAEVGGKVRVGLDDLARRLLPEPRTVELPPVGSELRAGDVAAVVVCGGKRVEIAAPTGGTVAEVNEQLAREPGLLKDAYTRGWILALAPRDAAYAQFPKGKTARGWMSQELARLSRMLEADGLAAADGGEIQLDLGSVEPAAWEGLVQAFLRKKPNAQ